MFCVIGAGKVVSQRLLPALAWAGVDLSSIEVHGLLDDPDAIRIDDCVVPVLRHRVEDVPHVVADTQLVPWLATPPMRARRELLQAARGRRLVLEKPLGWDHDDLLWLEAHLELVSQAFVLSYYVQEKFASLLWMLRRLPVPSLLKASVVLPREVPVLLGARVVLQEPLTRASGDQVSSWALNGPGPCSVLEFAVHAPAVLLALGAPDVFEAHHTRHMSTVSAGPNWSASVARHAAMLRTVEAFTSTDSILADAGTRSATWGSCSVEVPSSVPNYGVLVAFVLGWLTTHDSDNLSYVGDLPGQLAALRALA